MMFPWFRFPGSHSSHFNPSNVGALKALVKSCRSNKLARSSLATTENPLQLHFNRNSIGCTSRNDATIDTFFLCASQSSEDVCFSHHKLLANIATNKQHKAEKYCINISLRYVTQADERMRRKHVLNVSNMQSSSSMLLYSRTLSYGPTRSNTEKKNSS